MDNREDDAIRRWLVKPESRRILERVARQTERWLRRRNVRPPTLDPPEASGEERVAEVLSELECFLLERSGELRTLIASGADHLEKYLERSFRNHLLDRSRSLQTDPWRFFYRASADILRHAEDVHHHLRSGRFFMYSMKIPATCMSPLREEELEGIAFPPQSRLNLESLLPAATLVSLAAHFWREACAVRSRDLWIDLRDFVNWAFRHVPAPKGVALDGETEPPWGERGISPLGGRQNGDGAASQAGPALLDRWASAFIERLSPEEREVFYCRMVLELDWAKISRQLGYSGPSGAFYRYRQAEAKLKSFLRDREKLSPEDFDHREWELFCEALREGLKKTVSRP